MTTAASPSTNPIATLTQAEAVERADLLSVQRYDIAVDLTGLLEGDTVESVSTITFDCMRPGASTFVDCVAEIRHATLNGRSLDPASAQQGRLPLPDLAEHNVLVIAAAQSDTASSAGILRSVDESDKLVYVWMSFEPDDARRVWACFDQPDLKAPHAFTVTAPESWTVTSNGAPDSVTPAEGEARLWAFPDTPSLSTYVVVINAGPFYELRRELGGYDLGLYSRQSTARYLDRDADELFDLTARGLAFFGERFAQPFPQRRYDQVFVPNMGGAMENWGCVTWTDFVLFRSTPTYAERYMRAEVLMHEMAHMWFGDLVTMQWWDDLWLNEAFASWASTWACVNATEFTDGWAVFLASLKLRAYDQDLGPASHPIRSSVPDVASAMANFDAITYAKGSSVLKQLVTHVGEDAFVAGLRAYFARHAWSNTRLADLMAAVGEAAGRDLGAWTTDWFDRAGTDSIALSLDDSGPATLTLMAPEGSPRPHTLAVGSYRARPDDTLELVGSQLVSTDGDRSAVDLPQADLHLLNDDDLTFASVRPDPASLRVLREHAGALPTPIARAVAAATARDLLVREELSASDALACLLGVIGAERSAGVAGPVITLAVEIAELWAPPKSVASMKAEIAQTLAPLIDVESTRDLALRALAACASTEDHFAMLAPAATDDFGLAWRVLARRSELGLADPAEVGALADRDPDPEAAAQALAARGSAASAEAKAELWDAVFRHRTVHAGPTLRRVAAALWRPGQEELLQPYAGRYLDELRAVSAGGGLLEVGSLAGSMFPVLADAAFAYAAQAFAEEAQTPPMVRSVLISELDLLRRRQRSRARG